MKTFFTRTVVLATALLLGGNAMADDNLWFGVKAGTLGIGLEASWRALPWFDIGIGANLYDYEDSGSQAGINYDATLALDTFYATASFRFPLSPFRMTVGAYSNGNEIELVSQPMGSYEIGDIPYSPDDVGTLRSTSSFDDFAPYLGAGFDFELVAGYNGPAEFGAVDAQKDGDFSGVVGFAIAAINEDGANLGHGLDDEHAGHDGHGGPVALKVGFVDGHVFVAENALEGRERHDPVNE